MRIWVFFLCIAMLRAPAAHAAVYCVNDQTGADGLSGLASGEDCGACAVDDSEAWKSLENVNHSAFRPGDRVCLRRGGVWNEQLTPPDSGSPDSPIVYDAYGAGPLPKIDAPDGSPNSVDTSGRSAVQFRHLDVTAETNGTTDSAALRVSGGSAVKIADSVLENALDISVNVIHVESSPGFEITGCQISGGNRGIFVTGASGFPGLIAENKIFDITSGLQQDWDGIRVLGESNANFAGLVIRGNEITGFKEDGIDLRAAAGVVAENNFIHDPAGDFASISGIKLGASSSTPARDNIIRRNFFRNIANGTNGFHEAVKVAQGPNQIVQNVIQGVYDAGVFISEGAAGIEVLDNVVIEARRGVVAENKASATVQGNVLNASEADLEVRQGSSVTGGRNVMMSDAGASVLDTAKYSGKDTDVSLPP